MLTNALIQVAVFFFLVLAVTVPLGAYMTNVFSGRRTFLDPVLRPFERLIYRTCGIQPGIEMTWVEYSVSMLLFSLVGMLTLYAIERLQGVLPLNPQGLPGVSPSGKRADVRAPVAADLGLVAHAPERHADELATRANERSSARATSCLRPEGRRSTGSGRASGRSACARPSTRGCGP